MATQYRVPVLEKFEWQQAVIDKDLSTPPVSPVKGDRYLVKATGLGAWAGKDNNFAWFDGSVWKFDAPMEGHQTWVKDEDRVYFFNGTSWGAGANMSTSVYDTDADGIVDKAETVDDGAGNSSTAVDVKDAVTKRHTQNTDQYVDFGGASQTSAAQIKEAYDRRGSYDTDLGVILFNLNP